MRELDGWNPATSSGLVGRENFAVRAKLDGSNAVATQYLLSDKIDDGLGRIDVGGTTEVRWTSFGPNCGLKRVEMLGTLYRHYPRVDTQEPNWEWPFGLVPLIGGGGLYFECVYFTDPPYSVVLYDGHDCDRDKPLIQSLKPIAPSLETRFEAWLADIKLW